MFFFAPREERKERVAKGRSLPITNYELKSTGEERVRSVALRPSRHCCISHLIRYMFITLDEHKNE